MSGVVLGVDSSTQSCKVEARDADTGALLGTGTAPHPPAFPPSAEQHPDDWWTALVQAVRQCLASGVDGAQVRAVSVAAQCHGLVPLDAAHRVIRPAKLWNDTTSSGELARLRDTIGAGTWARRTGSVPTAAFTIGKLAWLARTEPASFAALRHVLLPHDELTRRLTGALVTDRSEASGTGYFDAATGAYLPEVLALVDADRDLVAMMPTVLEPTGTAGTVRAEVAAELGISPDAVVGAGGGDQHASALGLGIGPGDLAVAIGTSGVVFSTSRDSVHDTRGMVDGVADMTGGYLPLVSTLNAARVTDAMTRWLGVDHAELSALALAAPETVGPVLVAYLDGERKPDLPDARGVLSGLTSASTREELARAAYEGVLLGLLSGVSHLERVGVPLDGRVVVVGGGARSLAYPQLLADLLQRPVHAADPDEAAEATARGACVQAAAVAAGADITTVRDAWTPDTPVVAEPRPLTRDPRPAYAAAVADILARSDRSPAEVPAWS